jgi:RNA polymerase sigma factor (sigma-70 family)
MQSFALLVDFPKISKSLIRPTAMKSIKANNNLSSGLPSDEAELWLLVMRSDEKALSYFYVHYYKKLFNYGSRFVTDRAIAEDAIQEIFIDLWNKRSTLNEIRHTQQYLYRCLRNKIADKLSTFSNRIQPNDNFVRFELSLSHKSHYLTEQIDKDIKTQLVNLVASLPPKEKVAIFLIYFDGLSYTEAAAIMSLKVKTVYNLVHMAISKLKGNRETLTGSLLCVTF